MTPQDNGHDDAKPMCTELRCKGMYVSPQGPVENLAIIPGNTTHWWCDRTQYSIGPDRDLVSRSMCTPGRSCYRPPGGPA